MTGEEAIAAVMTNIFVRGAEVLLAPIWIAFKSKSFKKDWTPPMRVGFILIVLSSCLFLEEKITQQVRTFTYSEEQAIRAWLDSLKYAHTLSSSKQDTFRFIVTSPIAFSIFKRRDAQGDIYLEAGISVSPETLKMVEKLTESQRKRLWIELRFELVKYNIELPSPYSEDLELKSLTVGTKFPLSPENQQILSERLYGLKRIGTTIDLVFESWKAQGKL